jgi:hypothetical protein
MHPNDGRVVSNFIVQAKQLLNWQPSILLEQGLLATIAYFEKIIQQSAQQVYNVRD